MIIIPLLLLPHLSSTGSAADCRPATIQEFMEVDGSTRVIAHRGFSGAAPENTLVAIQKAIEVGADMVEVDVTVTADGHVILLHDETLDRTTNGKGKPYRKPLAEIRRLDAGSWFAPEFAGERIPTLAESLETVKDRVLINIEIKSEAVERGVVPKVAALIVEHEMLDSVVVSSFSPEALRRMKTTEPAVVTASLHNKKIHTGRDPLEIVQEVGSRGFNISGQRLTPAMVDRCHRHGIPVAVYTVNDPAAMHRLMEMGVDAVFTDHPDRMIGIVAGAEPVRADQAR
ncbi:MAG: glycerophosphodiester phosphodiesterase family protein [Thermoanaerobaculales bacterium]|jgi:glycerophosphoryl diester phosphodiesterase|nr:glycerophosphodiester phosphodiesterase family protein [Thermoanaerobaculales bacterium]